MTWSSPRLQIKKGASRIVVLAGSWAIKLPRPRSWQSFLEGLLANMNERSHWRQRFDRLCPIAFALPGGWLNVMRRAVPLTDVDWEVFDPVGFSDLGNGFHLPGECKRDDYGKVDGRIVMVDYGGAWWG